MLAAAGLLPASASAQAPFVLELEPETSAVIRDRAVGAEVGCSAGADGSVGAPCTAAASAPRELEVELAWGGEHADRDDRLSFAPEPGARYRPRWIERSGERAGGAVFLIVGQLGAAALGFFGGVLSFGSSAGAGLTMVVLGTMLGASSLSVGSYFAGLRSHAIVEPADGVTASVAIDAGPDHVVAGVRGTF